MRLSRRLAVLTLAAFLALAWALDHNRNISRARLAAPGHVPTPPTVDDARLKDLISGSEAKTADKTAKLKKARGTRLRDKGESIWGGQADLVDLTTGTLTAR
jgi:hypothetical protein